MTVLITLTLAGINTDSFILFSDVDNYLSAFASNISRQDLLDGYVCSTVPNGTTIIRVLSTGTCTNYVDLVIDTSITTTTTSSTLNPGITTTTTTMPTTTTTTTVSERIMSLSSNSVVFDTDGFLCSGFINTFDVTSNSPWYVVISGSTGDASPIVGTSGVTTVTIGVPPEPGQTTFIIFYWTETGLPTGLFFMMTRNDIGESCA